MTNPLNIPEMREKFLRHVWGMIDFWDSDTIHNPDTRSKLEGLAFSILAAIDGSSCELPAFELIPHPHEDDEEYLKSRGDGWWTPEDISEGYLHEELYKYKPGGVECPDEQA